MPGWEKHTGGTFHVMAVSQNVRIHRNAADGAITAYISTYDHGVQTTTSLPITDDQRAGWVEALTTEPDDEGANQ